METTPREINNSVVFSSNTLLNIHKVTNVNGENIYQIDMGDCLRYVSPKNYIVYIGIIYNDVIHIFNLIEDGVFPEEFKNMFNNIDKAKIQILLGKLRTPDSNRIMRSILLFFQSIHDFLYIEKISCPKIIRLDAAKEIINSLNAQLNTKPGCESFRINIDYVFNLKEPSKITSYLEGNPYTLLLCLFINNMCVSSLTIKFDLMDARKMMIDSRTDTRYEGRKFNKLLRAVIIFIAKALDERKLFISSEAINPISALLMIKSFNAICKNGSGEILLDKMASFEDITSAIETQPNKSVLLTVDLNDINIQNAIEVFTRTISEINCAPIASAGGRRKIKRTIKKRTSKRKGKNRRKTKRTKK